ncbi:MAG: hypothetical protein ACRD36_08655 [Candidatus Acidiferrum sp.]
MAGIADTFPPASEAEWRTLVERALDGRPFESLLSTTIEGLKIGPIERAPRQSIVNIIRIPLSRPPFVL